MKNEEQNYTRFQWILILEEEKQNAQMSNKRSLLEWANSLFDKKTCEMIQDFARRQKRLSSYRMFTKKGALYEFNLIFEFCNIKKCL